MNTKYSHFVNNAHIFIFATLFLIALPLGSTVFALGQVTEPIVIKNAQRGQEPQETMIVVNNDDKEVEIGLSASGSVSKWAKFFATSESQEPIQSFKMSASSRSNVFVRFSIPNDAPNGTYKGYVAVTKKSESTSAQKDESSVSLSQKIERDVTIEIGGKENIAFDASIIPNKYDVKKNESLKIRVIYDNRGNVSITPQIEFKIKKDEQVIYNTIFPYPESVQPVRPLTLFEIPTIEIPTSNFEKGKYVAEIAMSQHGGSPLDKEFGFSVDMIDNSQVGGVVDQRNIFKGFSDINAYSLVIIVFSAVAMLFGIVRYRRLKVRNNDNENENT